MRIRPGSRGMDAAAPVVAWMATPTLSHAGPRTVPGDTTPRERRRGAERRAVPDRRAARRDRRRGRPDGREVRDERRRGPADRRSGRPDRRLGGDRRYELGPAPGPPPVDPDVVFWALNVVCWAAVTLVALLYGA